MKVENIQAIDVHGHYGPYAGAQTELQNWLMSGAAEQIVRYASIARTERVVVSPLLALMPQFAGDAVAGNRDAAEQVALHPALLQWVVIHPGQPKTFDQADEMLRSDRCVGIKIHPEAHGYPIVEHGERIFAFAAERKAAVLAHSGERNSLPEHFAMFANEYPDIRLIIAHLGFSWNWDFSLQVRAIQQSKHGNLYVDTSSMFSIVPNLIEWAAGEIGADRILYGTDTPLYSTAMQRARIDCADLSDGQKRMILRDNAVKLLKLPE